MFYDKESDFEDDLVAVLKRHGWTDGVLEYPTEQDLIDNWANILFDNNKGIDRLNGQRLTKGEMAGKAGTKSQDSLFIQLKIRC